MAVWLRALINKNASVDRWKPGFRCRAAGTRHTRLSQTAGVRQPQNRFIDLSTSSPPWKEAVQLADDQSVKADDNVTEIKSRNFCTKMDGNGELYSIKRYWKLIAHYIPNLFPIHRIDNLLMKGNYLHLNKLRSLIYAVCQKSCQKWYFLKIFLQLVNIATPVAEVPKAIILEFQPKGPVDLVYFL